MAKFVNAKIFENPLPGIDARVKRVRVGTPLKDIVAECTAPMVCIVDGIPLKREYWMQRKVCSGDKIEFHAIYLGGRGGGGSRSILAIVATIALAYFAPMMVAGWGGAFTTTGLAGGPLSILGRVVASGIVLLGNALISAVIMPKPQGGANALQGDRPSSIYNVDTQGNSAKIFSPIPVQYGRVKAYPDYASQPYAEYKLDTNADGDQYYYALFCLGQGEYDIESIQIADTPISTYKDVLVSRILPPGQMPTVVNPTMITSDAVSGQSLDGKAKDKTNPATPSAGPFVTCAANRKVKKLYIDLVFPRGLYVMNDEGRAQQCSAGFSVFIREIDNKGRPKQFGHSAKHEISATAASITPQRRTYSFDVPPGRYEVSVSRMGFGFDPQDTRKADSTQWASLRCELVDSAPLCKTATHYELVMCASEQLSSLSQRKISIICTRKVKNFEGQLVPSRSPVLALYDKWKNDVYGDGLPDSRIDLPTLKRLYDLCNTRQDWFDYRFENRITSNDADQVIAKVFRSLVLQRNGCKTVIRDELVDMPVTIFNPQNTNEGSVSMDYLQITEETADGVIVEYFDKFLWDWVEIECPAPGFTYTSSTAEGYNPALPSMQNPVRMTLDGITGWHQAKREGTYYAHTNTLRRQFISWSTELQGILVHYGAAVMMANTLYNAEKGGEVADYREADGAIRLTGDVTVGSRLLFMYSDGTMSPPLSFRSVGDGWIIIEGGATNLNYADYATERTKYVVLDGEMIRNIVKITAVEPRGIGNSGAPEYTLRGVVDVPEVHTCDNEWLPKPGDPPQDDDPDNDDTQNPVSLGERYDVLTQRATWPGSGYPATLVFYPNGNVRMKYYDLAKGVVEGTKNTITSNPAYIDNEIQGTWYKAAPVAGIGSTFWAQVFIALDPQYEPYLYRGEWGPQGQDLIMQGMSMHSIEGVMLGENDQKIYNMLKSRFPNRDVYANSWSNTDNESWLGRVVELKSTWEGFSGLPTPVIEGYVVIRNRDYVFATAPFKMGMAHQM